MAFSYLVHGEYDGRDSKRDDLEGCNTVLFRGLCVVCLTRSAIDTCQSFSRVGMDSRGYRFPVSFRFLQYSVTDTLYVVIS
jgi:hypothetical protein